jgi:KDO2-lipid IV(A) lauroyltransferase
VVELNLELAFPGQSPEWRDQVAAASYSHLGREAVATLRMAWMTPQEIVARTRIDGFEAFQGALAEGSGVILATGHLGNWEVGAACLAARGVPVDGVTKAMSNERFGQALADTRERLGYRNVDVSDAPRTVPRSLKEGRMVALLGDQNIRKGGVFVPFFGSPAATARGVATFALRTGAPVFLGVAVHEPGRPHRYRGILERIPVEPTGDTEEDIRRITAAHTAALERLVREYPEQYFWQHKRWHTRPSDAVNPEPPSGEAV